MQSAKCKAQSDERAFHCPRALHSALCTLRSAIADMPRFASTHRSSSSRASASTAPWDSSVSACRTVQDLLWHLPFRYLDASSVTPLAKAEVGLDVACVGRVVNKGVLPTRRRLRIFHAVLRDASGLLECVWPGQAFLDRSIDVGDTILVAGPVRYYHGRQMQPREFMVLNEAGSDDGGDPVVQGKVMPVYPATEGLSHKLIRALIDRHLDDMVRLSPEVLSPALLQELGPPSGSRRRCGPCTAPTRSRRRRRAGRRLAFDELLDLQLMLGRARLLARTSRAGIRFEVKRDLTTRLRESLPWQLTDDQKQALREITGDMTSRRSHAPPAHGRRRNRQDGGRALRDAARGGERLSVGADGTHRAARRAARGHTDPAARAARPGARAPDRAAVGGRKGRSAAPDRGRRVIRRHRHPRAGDGANRLRSPGPGRDRRAASLRRGPARGAHREGRIARRAAADRDAHSALARAHALWRPRHVGAPHAPAGAGPGSHHRPGTLAA